MSTFGRLRKKIASLGRAEPRAGYCFVVEASGLVAIGHTTEIGDALACIVAAIPGAKPTNIWATDVPGAEKNVCDLAHGTLQDKAAGSGWFRCSADDAWAAIKAAAVASGFPDFIKFDMGVRS